ncbi:MAG: peptidylprolyl isomerase [Anaerolineae bacterium]|nr:peptidylprolyl isomerase [Anaerolineae bacterium]
MSRLPWSLLALLLLTLSVAGCNTGQSSTPTPQTLPPALSQGQGVTPPAANAPGATAKPSTQGGGQAPATQPTAAAKGQAPAQGGQAPSAATKGDGTIAAVVNGEPISLADYQREATQARSFLMSDPKFSANTAEGQQALQTINNQVLESLIGEALIRQYAQKNNITVTDAELNQSLDALIKDMGGAQEFEKALAARGLTREMFTTTQRTQLLGNKVRDAVTTDVPQTMEQVHARHILVQTPDQAAQVLNRLNKGEDFAKVAREVSQDPSTASAGGDLGWFPRGLMVPEFEQAAFNLKPRELSPAIQTQFGYHIIQVLEKDANRKLPDERWQELRQMKFQDWLEDQRDAAKIERFVQ